MIENAHFVPGTAALYVHILQLYTYIYIYIYIYVIYICNFLGILKDIFSENILKNREKTL